MKKIEHLSEIYDSYDSYIIDLWGVMHNGIKLNKKAIDTVENLYKKNKKIIFLSNAPRPSQNVRNFLRQLKMNEKFLKNIFTSGEAAIKSIKNNQFGKKFFHLGPQRDACLFEGLEQKKTKINKCDFIICTGLYENFMNDLNYYKDLLKENISKKLICTNPDLIVHRGATKEYCAGKIAEIYKQLGGEVIYFGKPYKEIYESVLSKKEKCLAIGDNLNTDIKGANNFNIDSLFITNGVHKNECKQEKNLKKILKNYKVKAQFFQKELYW
ncbi:TIGR01459 family HAD-type hydrolase [Pelagibacteraceae bacterium]|nr:TIGR01459 family HAD-type hydrolase [Pelagibacteraceae bacterium]